MAVKHKNAFEAFFLGSLEFEFATGSKKGPRRSAAH